ncbi:MAG: CHAD domain-containing protein [Planctomycetes bacterium]|nr:CHAD domain-containing protein [Planctomycetota bacterium]
MSFRLTSGESVAEDVRRIAREQIDRAIREIEDERLDRREAVHQVRKRCKKLRGLVRLVRGVFDGYARENAWYRDAARSLSHVRDAEAMVETFDGLLAEAGGQQFSSIRQELVARREKLATDEQELKQRLDEFRRLMREGRERVDGWSLDACGFDAVAEGFTSTYARGRKTMKDAYTERTPEAFHEWRKRVKYGWYHHRLLRGVCKAEMQARQSELARLSERLGDDHNLAVLRATLAADPESFGDAADLEMVLGLIDRTRQRLERRARPLGRRLFAEKPKAFLARIRRYWKASGLSH